jgi:hypothetical protein
MRNSLIAAGIILLLSSGAAADTWLCKQKDGSEVFSDSGSKGDCAKYYPKSELGKAAGGAMGQPNRPDYPDTFTQTPPANQTMPAPSRTRQAGEMTFEKFRMLSTGMTEGQVLAKVGSPSSRFVTSCILTAQVVTCPTIWTYLLGDGWTADLIFANGRLQKIDQTKTP